MKTRILLILAVLVFIAGPAKGYEFVVIIDEGTTPTNLFGGGTFESVAKAACDYWKSRMRTCRVHDEMPRIVHFAGGSISSRGEHTTILYGDGFEKEGRITIQTNNPYAWYADPNPLRCVLTNYTEKSVDLGYGPINSGRYGTLPPEACQDKDLFSTMIHELGHFLRLSYGNDSFEAERANGYIVASVEPFVGMHIALQEAVGYGYYTTHLVETGESTLLMATTPGLGVRMLASDLDILAIAGDMYTDLNWHTGPELKIGPSTTSAGKNLPGVVLDLSWTQPLGMPAGTTRYVVQSCSDLQSGNWTTIATNSPQQVDGRYTATIVTVPGANAFFRLKAE